jgi:hypothetical protein
MLCAAATARPSQSSTVGRISTEAAEDIQEWYVVTYRDLQANPDKAERFKAKSLEIFDPLQAECNDRHEPWLSVIRATVEAPLSSPALK